MKAVNISAALVGTQYPKRKQRKKRGRANPLIMVNKFKVGDIVRSRSNSAWLYCIFKINPDSTLNILTADESIWTTCSPQIFYKTYSTKKRKKLFLKNFKEKLFDEYENRLTNLDYIEVVEALKRG
jgi:hypothetical protein